MVGSFTRRDGRPARVTGWRIAAGSVLVALVQVVGTHGAARGQTASRGLDVVAYLLLLAGPSILLARKRFPGSTLVGVYGVTTAYLLLHYPLGPVFLSLVVGLFYAVRADRHLVAVGVVVAGYATALWVRSAVLGLPAPRLPAIFGLAAWLLLLLSACYGVRGRAARITERRRTQAEETRRLAADERLQIARELHDVVAHNISLINVQAGVGLHLMDRRPEQAREALVTIKAASGETLRELRSVLGVLRGVDEDAPRAPAPSIANLDSLLANAAATGATVHTEIIGVPRPLPAPVDLAAYRIVQEALTNVGRHADPATATVAIRYGEGEIVVQVDDDGHVPAGRSADSRLSAGTPADGRRTEPGAGSGNGIAGMRERATALDGEFSAGRRGDGGFRVSARLPIGGP